jgi:hypothetical protein
MILTGDSRPVADKLIGGSRAPAPGKPGAAVAIRRAFDGQDRVGQVPAGSATFC